jgi:hypothetical protein
MMRLGRFVSRFIRIVQDSNFFIFKYHFIFIGIRLGRILGELDTNSLRDLIASPNYRHSTPTAEQGLPNFNGGI